MSLKLTPEDQKGVKNFFPHFSPNLDISDHLAQNIFLGLYEPFLVTLSHFMSLRVNQRLFETLFFPNSLKHPNMHGFFFQFFSWRIVFTTYFFKPSLLLMGKMLIRRLGIQYLLPKATTMLALHTQTGKRPPDQRGVRIVSSEGEGSSQKKPPSPSPGTYPVVY